MTSPWRKVIRDLWQERTPLVVLAIAIGIAGCLAVLSAYAVLTRELGRGFLETNPASATLHTDAVDDALVSAVLADRDVSQAQARRILDRSDQNRAGGVARPDDHCGQGLRKHPAQQICAGAGCVASGTGRNTD